MAHDELTGLLFEPMTLYKSLSGSFCASRSSTVNRSILRPSPQEDALIVVLRHFLCGTHCRGSVFPSWIIAADTPFLGGPEHVIQHVASSTRTTPSSPGRPVAYRCLQCMDNQPSKSVMHCHSHPINHPIIVTCATCLSLLLYESSPPVRLPIRRKHFCLGRPLSSSKPK
jgi:hypothetical protein